MHRGRSTWFRTRAAQIARRRRSKRAVVALARRIGVILHRMWVEGAEFRSDGPAPKVA
jgi:transposase